LKASKSLIPFKNGYLKILMKIGEIFKNDIQKQDHQRLFLPLKNGYHHSSFGRFLPGKFFNSSFSKLNFKFQTCGEFVYVIVPPGQNRKYAYIRWATSRGPPGGPRPLVQR